jgi:NADPH:quinone reductase-like Zn-dependent oxidoreductase
VKAIRLHEPGGLEVLRYEEVPTPTPGPGEALVRLRAAALNHRDVFIRLGRQLTDAMPFTPGSDGAGVVEAVGEGVANVQPGDEVVIYPVVPDNTCPACLAGQQSLCESFQILGGPRDGTYAEYIVMPALNIYPKPKALSWEEAAAFPLAGLTAYRMVVSRAEVRPGELVLIHGIGGGVATFALQFAKAAGATVIVTSSSDQKLARAEGLGADHMINYAATDWRAEVRRLTNGRGVDVVVETVGAATWAGSLEAVRKGGRVAICGATTGTMAESNLRQIYWHQLTVIGSTMGTHAEFGQMLRLLEAGKVKPVVDTVMPLAEAGRAHQRMEEQGQFGKIVLATL